MSSSHPVTAMRTVTGLYMDLLNPSTKSVSAIDIAYSLARIKRFTGHTTISVAQHSIEVMLALYARADFPAILKAGLVTPREALLYALLHDAHEAYTGDISKPMNNTIASTAGWKESPVNKIKRDIQRVIHAHFRMAGPNSCLREAIAVADRKLVDIDRWLFEGIRSASMNEAEAQGQFLRTLERLLTPNGASFVGQFDGWPGNENEQRPSLKDFGRIGRTPKEQVSGNA